MQLIPIRVEACAGEPANETPRRFLWDGRWLEVEAVVDRWYQGGGNPEGPMADYFKVVADDLHEYLLKHDRESDEWHFARRW